MEIGAQVITLLTGSVKIVEIVETVQRVQRVVDRFTTVVSSLVPKWTFLFNPRVEGKCTDKKRAPELVTCPPGAGAPTVLAIAYSTSR